MKNVCSKVETCHNRRYAAEEYMRRTPTVIMILHGMWKSRSSHNLSMINGCALNTFRTTAWMDASVNAWTQMTKGEGQRRSGYFNFSSRFSYRKMKPFMVSDSLGLVKYSKNKFVAVLCHFMTLPLPLASCSHSQQLKFPRSTQISATRKQLCYNRKSIARRQFVFRFRLSGIRAACGRQHNISLCFSLTNGLVRPSWWRVHAVC